VFGTDFDEIWTPKALNIILPPEFKSPFSYIVAKAFAGCHKILFSGCPNLEQVRVLALTIDDVF
jgi:hypothetical protein